MRPTKTSTAAELQRCAEQAGCATVAEWCTTMFELLEDIRTRSVGSRRINPMQTDSGVESRLNRILKGY